jgi:hypothetical protein
MCFGTLLKLSLEHHVFSYLTSVCVIGDYKLLYSNITFYKTGGRGNDSVSENYFGINCINFGIS